MADNREHSTSDLCSNLNVLFQTFLLFGSQTYSVKNYKGTFKGVCCKTPIVYFQSKFIYDI